MIGYEELLAQKGYTGYESEFECVLKDANCNIYSSRKKGIPEELAESIPVREGFKLSQTSGSGDESESGSGRGSGRTVPLMTEEETVTQSQLCQIIQAQAGVPIDPEELKTAIECLDLSPTQVPRSAIPDIFSLLSWGLSIHLQEQSVQRSIGLDGLVQESVLTSAYQQGQVTALLEDVHRDKGYLDLKEELTNSRIEAMQQSVDSNLNYSLQLLSEALQVGKQTHATCKQQWTTSSEQRHTAASKVREGRAKLSKKLAT